MKKSPGWKTVNRLIDEQKYQAALEVVGKLRAAAEENADYDEWTRALIREVQLRTGLHGYETSVRFLREEKWPDSPRHKLILELFYARSLVMYMQAYSWEIGQRERVESGDEIDLKRWTRDQLVAEANGSFLRVWEDREAWGAGSIGDLAEFIRQNDYPARIREHSGMQ